MISPENQNRILDLKSSVLNDDLQAIYLHYIYPPFHQWRERIARQDLFAENKLQWKSPIHEFIDGIDGIDGRKVKYFDAISILHDTTPDRHALKKDRNISILRKHYTSGATDDRGLYIYAVECLHSLLKDEGEQVLGQFFSQVSIPEYRYEICSKMYNLHMVASMIRLPSYGTPEAEAYTHGPWEALGRAHFRLENIDAARRMAAEALARDAPDARWLTELAHWREAAPAFEPLPPQWLEWTEGNRRRGVPRPTIIRILKENGFGPRQIVEGLRASDREGKT